MTECYKSCNISLLNKKPPIKGAHGANMKSILIIINTAYLLQSCCVYHSSQNIGDKKVSEFGVAPYGSRPIKQAMEADSE